MRGRGEYGGGNRVIEVAKGNEEEGTGGGGNQEELAFET